MIDKTDAELASLPFRERMLLLQEPVKFCGRLAKHMSHGWICARKQVCCPGIQERESQDPIEMVSAIAMGFYAPAQQRFPKRYDDA